MKTYKLTLLLFLLAAFFFSCQKERSFENDAFPSDGQLQADASLICQGNIVSGVYKADTALNTSHFVDVSVQVNTPGVYSIYTDTVNGYFFRAQGTFSASGVQTVRLAGSGKPLAAGSNVFTVFYDSTNCFFNVIVTGPGGGGSAVFTLNGSPGNCTGADVQGAYVAGTAVTVSNKVTLQVNVTTTGTYTVTTAVVNGVTFSGSGNFTATGPQTVVLAASGTPTAAGSFNVPVTIGTSSCQFPLTVTGAGSAAVYTFNGAPGNCTNAVINGSYYAGTALTAVNTVVLNVNVTTIGTWNITTTTTTGMTFSGSGSFTATGAQTITLTGSGTPVAAGTFNIAVTTGSSTCSFSITCQPADYFPRTANSNWSYEWDDDPDDTTYVTAITPTISALGNTYNIFMSTDDISQGMDSAGYYRRSGGDYFQYINLADYLLFDNDQWVENVFLKDNQASGFSWTTSGYSGTISGTPVTIRIKFTILQKDVSVVVNGTSYANTIVVEEKYEAFNGTAWVDATAAYGTYRSYYSRNIGLIKLEGFDPSGMPAFQLEMRRYQVF